MAQKLPSWEEYAAENNVPVEVPEKQGEGENADRHHWFDVHNQYTDMVLQSGEDPTKYGIKNVHEQGQSVYAGWNQAWQEILNSNPEARAWANSREGQQWMKEYNGIPLQAWYQYQSMQHATTQHGSDMLSPMSNGLFYSGGPVGAWYDKFGHKVGSGYVPGVTYSSGPNAGMDIAQNWQANHPGQSFDFNNAARATGVPSGPTNTTTTATGNTPVTTQPYGQPVQLPNSTFSPTTGNTMARSASIPSSPPFPGSATGLGPNFGSSGSSSGGSMPMPNPEDATTIPDLLNSMAFQRLRSSYGYASGDSADILGLKGGGFAWGDVPPWLRGIRPQSRPAYRSFADVLKAQAGGGGAPPWQPLPPTSWNPTEPPHEHVPKPEM